MKVSKPYSLKLNTTEAYSFLKDVSHLLMESGFNVFVPSFWNKEQQKGIQPRITMKAVPSTGSAGFSLNQIIQFNWQIARGDQVVSKEEFERLVQLKIPLVNIRGQWIELQPDTALNILKSMSETKEMPFAQFLRLALAGGGEQGLPFTEVEAGSWLGGLVDNLRKNIFLEEIGQPKSSPALSVKGSIMDGIYESRWFGCMPG